MEQSTDSTRKTIPIAGILAGFFSLAGLAVPATRGVADWTLVAALSLTVLTIVVFLARWQEFLPRPIGGGIAAGSSVGVVLLSGYAVNQGVSGALPLVEIGISIPTVFLAFLAAGVMTGLAAAEYGGVTGAGLSHRLTGFLTGCGLAVGGMAAYLIVAVLLMSIGFAAIGSLSDTQLTLIEQTGMALGITGVTAAYLSLSERPLSFLDIRRPTLSDLGWFVGGLIGIFVALIGISMLMAATGTESASHATEQQAQQNPEALLILIPAAIFIIGPFEELLYRNVIQKHLYGQFSRVGAVVVASVIFAAIHTAAYWTAGPGAVLGSLGVVFALSLVLGAVYERTENLLVPALIHGIYDAVIFVSLYTAYI